jgi:hypothetical protein
VKTYQLRVYRVREGELDEWVEEWRERVLPLREAAGFEVLGPWVTPAEHRFVWIVGHDEFEIADAAYYQSPERAALQPDPARHLEDVQTFLMEPA